MSGGIQEFLTPAPASTPLDIVAGRDSRLYFVEYDASKFGVTDAAGNITEIATPTANAGPADLTLAPDGTIWFSEFFVGKIARLNDDNTITEFFVSSGSGPNGIAADASGNIWFAETWANKIGRYDVANGTFDEFALPTGGALPIDIIRGDDDNLWFTEWAGKVGRITPDGNVEEFGGLTGGANPAGIVAGPDGNIYFTEYGAGKVGRLNYDGSGLIEFSVPTVNSVPYALTAGPDGNVYFAESGANKIASLAPDGAFVEYQITTAGSTPTGIAASNDGANIWFTESGASQIGRLNLDLKLRVPSDQSSLEGEDVGLQSPASGGRGFAYYSYTATGLPDGLSIDSQRGTIGGTISRSAAETNSGTYQVTVTVTDGIDTRSGTFHWVVGNAPLAFSPPANQQSQEGGYVFLTLPASGGERGWYTYTATGLPQGLALDDQSGVISGVVGFDAAETNGGNYSITVTVSDGAASRTQSFAWSVTNVALSLASPDDQTNVGQDRVALPLTADGGESFNYHFSASGLPSGLAIDTDTGIISGTLDASAAALNGGNYLVSVSVSDGTTTATQSFAWSISNVALTLEAPFDRHDGEGKAVEVDLVSRGGLGLIIYSAVGLPAGISINGGTGVISGRVDYGAADVNVGEYEVTVSAYDGYTSQSVSFHWTVVNVPLAIDAIGDQFASEGEEIHRILVGSGGESATLTFSAANLPTGLSLDATSGLISGVVDYSAAAANGGLYAVTVSVSDGYTSASRSFTWHVSDAPRARDTSDPVLTASAVTFDTDTSGFYSGVVATFHDTDPSVTTADMTAVVHWGDGSTSVGIVTQLSAGDFQVSGNNLYAAPRFGAATVTIVDSRNGVRTTVGPSNRAPSVTMDLLYLGTDDGGIKGLDLTRIGSDSDGDTLSTIITGSPSHGTLTYNSTTGLFDYRATSRYFGLDHFFFLVTDGSAHSETVRVDILVSDGINRGLDAHSFPLLANALFDAGGPRHLSVEQATDINDCWFVAAAAAVASRRPQTFRAAVEELPGGQFKVTHSKGETVTFNTPVRDGNSYSSSDGIWLSVLEKAYGEARREYLLNTPEYGFAIEPAYYYINKSNFGGAAIPFLTGHNKDGDTFRITSEETTRNKLKSAFAANKAVTVTIGGLGFRTTQSLGLVAQHTYTVLLYDATTDRVVVRNPYGFNVAVNTGGNVFRRRGEGEFPDDGRFYFNIPSLVKYFTYINYEQ